MNFKEIQRVHLYSKRFITLEIFSIEQYINVLKEMYNCTMPLSQSPAAGAHTGNKREPVLNILTECKQPINGSANCPHHMHDNCPVIRRFEQANKPRQYLQW